MHLQSDGKYLMRMPDDFHVHLRQGLAMPYYAAYAAEQFHRVTVMPNLVPPITTFKQAREYRNAILDNKVVLHPSAPPTDLDPKMTLYLTGKTDPDDLRRAGNDEDFIGAKLYPKGATTNSQDGVNDITAIFHLLEVMEYEGLPLLIHGEDPDPATDIFNREYVFLTVLELIIREFPRLKVVLEHITTASAARLVEHYYRRGLEAGRPTPQLGATITPHHLLINRNDLLSGGLKPHNYCMPIAKEEQDRLVLLAAATSGLPCFFAGTDSAPHPKHKKECECCAAGVFTHPYAIDHYADAFNSIGELSKLEYFTSVAGANFFGLTLNETRLQIIPDDLVGSAFPRTIPELIPAAGDPVVPFRAGQKRNWLTSRVTE